MKKLFWLLFRSGMILYPLFVVLMWYAIKDLENVFRMTEGFKSIVIWGVPAILSFSFAINARKNWTNHPTKKLSFLEFLMGKELEEEDTIPFVKATYPSIPKEYLTSKPTGWVLGTENDAYVSMPMLKDGLNVFGVGTPGSGKSTLLLGWLLANLYQDHIFKKRKTSTRPWNFFVVDIKGEIYRKITKLEGHYDASNSESLQVVEPSNRHSWGWDVFYLAHKEGYVSDTIKLKMVSDIAESLIPETVDNPFFSVNARKILSGVMFFYIEKGLDFVPIIQKLTRSNLDSLLREIIAVAEPEGNTIVIDKLKGFVGKAGNESIQDVESTLKQYLEVFSYPDIVYCLNNNPNRTSPRALNDGVTSIDLAIEESMLLTYQPLFRLISMQVLNHISTEFKEDDNRITSIIIDEAKRVGRIDGLDNTLATARSKHTNVVLLFQDISQFRDLYGKDKSDSILNICEMKIFLSGAGDKTTTEYLSEMIGQYVLESKNYSKKGLVFNGPSDLKYSEQHRNIITGKSLMSLREKKELIVIYYGKYMRFRKLEYFKDKYLGPIAKEIADYNEQHKND